MYKTAIIFRTQGSNLRSTQVSRLRCAQRKGTAFRIQTDINKTRENRIFVGSGQKRPLRSWGRETAAVLQYWRIRLLRLITSERIMYDTLFEVQNTKNRTTHTISRQFLATVIACIPYFPDHIFTGHDPTGGSRLQIINISRAGSGQEVFDISRVRVRSGRVTLTRPDPTGPDPM